MLLAGYNLYPTLKTYSFISLQYSIPCKVLVGYKFNFFYLLIYQSQYTNSYKLLASL